MANYESQCWRCKNRPMCSLTEIANNTKKGTAKCRYYVKGRHPAYTDLGGYPLYYLGSDNSVLCAKCADREPFASLIGHDINYEDPNMYCDECGKEIRPAYEND